MIRHANLIDSAFPHLSINEEGFPVVKKFKYIISVKSKLFYFINFRLPTNLLFNDVILSILIR